MTLEKAVIMLAAKTDEERDANMSLLCKNEMAGVIIDRFGKDIPMIPVDDDHFEARVDMALSFLFLGWIASMGDGIQIIAPDEAVEWVVDLQRRYNRQGYSIDFVDFLMDDEKEVIRRCEEAEKYLLTVTARHSYEDRL